MDSYKRGSWMLVFVGMLMTIVVISFARAAYGIELPYMKEGLLISFKQAGFLGTVNSLGYLSTILLAGVIASKWGSKNTILAGVAFVAGFAGLAFASSYRSSIIFMLLLGVGTSFIHQPDLSFNGLVY